MDIFVCMFDEMLIVVLLPSWLNVTPSSFANVAVNILVVVWTVTWLSLITAMCASRE